VEQRVKKQGFTHESTRNETVEWYTPPWLFEALGVTFDLDPCSAGEGHDFVPAKKRFTIRDDGLAQPWQGTVWCNPPYGARTKLWIEKLARHGDGIALVFNRMDAQWFQQWGCRADLVCAMKGRISFWRDGVRPDKETGGGAGSLLLAWGTVSVEAVTRVGLGVLLRRVGPNPEPIKPATVDAQGVLFSWL
jgi:hypothetical protein